MLIGEERKQSEPLQPLRAHRDQSLLGQCTQPLLETLPHFSCLAPETETRVLDQLPGVGCDSLHFYFNLNEARLWGKW